MNHNGNSYYTSFIPLNRQREEKEAQVPVVPGDSGSTSRFRPVREPVRFQTENTPDMHERVECKIRTCLWVSEDTVYGVESSYIHPSLLPYS